MRPVIGTLIIGERIKERFSKGVGRMRDGRWLASRMTPRMVVVVVVVTTTTFARMVAFESGATGVVL